MEPKEFINYLYNKEGNRELVREIFNWFRDETNISMCHIVFSNMGIKKPKESIRNGLRQAIKDADPSKMSEIASLTILTYLANMDSLEKERDIFYSKTREHLISKFGEEYARKSLEGLEPNESKANNCNTQKP